MAKRKSELMPHKREYMLQEVIMYYMKGYSNSEIADILRPAYKDVKPEEFDSLFRSAGAFIRDKTSVDIDKIIPQHVELYEQIYRKYDSLNHIPGKLKAMRRKEMLVGLHKESNYVEIHNEANITIEVEDRYDVTKLNPKEQKRLTELMKLVVRK